MGHRRAGQQSPAQRSRPHTEWLENARAEVVGEAVMGHLPDQQPEHEVSGVAVRRRRTRPEVQRPVRHVRHRGSFPQARARPVGVRIHELDPPGIVVDLRESAAMAEQLLDGDAVALLEQARRQLLDGVVQRQLVLVDQLHHDGRDHRLGEARDREPVSSAQHLARLASCEATDQGRGPALVADDGDDAGEGAGLGQDVHLVLDLLQQSAVAGLRTALAPRLRGAACGAGGSAHGAREEEADHGSANAS